MSYFTLFPFVDYPVENNNIKIQNINIRTDILDRYKRNRKYAIEYTIRDGETPEIIADRFYGDINLYWIVLMYNDIMDIWCDWPLSTSQLNVYVNDKYNNDVDGQHHVESISTGNIVGGDHTPYDRILVTNREHEEKVNEEKRVIRLLLPEFVSSVIRQHRELIQR